MPRLLGFDFPISKYISKGNGKGIGGSTREKYYNRKTSNQCDKKK